MFDAELVENFISKLKCGKAAGLDGISAEHLQNCHAILPGILAKLFNTMISLGYVPVNVTMFVVVLSFSCNVCRCMSFQSLRSW